MRYIKYFFQFLVICIFFMIFKILGPKLSSRLSGMMFEKIGPYFRSAEIIRRNILRVFPNINSTELNTIKNDMWNNYGRVFAEYMFIKNYRLGKLSPNVEVEGQEIIERIKRENKQVVFVSGHFANFELMAMHLEKSGIKLCAIYRPLNNFFLNKIMERIRQNYICRKQIKKGIGGLKSLVELKRKNFSTALMIDQRVSEGIASNFFNQKALTTTIPAQLVKKFNIAVVPIYIERVKDIKFKIKIQTPINFSRDQSIENITNELNIVLEKMIVMKPGHWIWSHNRWK